MCGPQWNYSYMERSMLWATSVFGPALFQHLLKLNKELEGEFFRFADETKLGGIANTLEDRPKMEKALNRLEHWASSNTMKFNIEKSRFYT